ncbi:MAG: radical SAM protein [Chlamydiota bacterium]
MFLRLIELFESVQGETSLAGLPTTFIRLAACNLRCTWCDTTYSFKKGELFPLEDILLKTKNYGHSHVCITGGEPLLQKPVYSLMTTLNDLGYKVNLETGGSLSTAEVDPRVTVILDIKCPGSGMADKNYFANLALLKPQDEVKFVLLDRQDFDYALEICKSYNLTNNVLFSPVFGKLDPQQLVQWILEAKYPIRLNMQVHKFIWTPETRGV